MSTRSQTRVGVVSDVHADVVALRDALAHLARFDCEIVLCAGDLIDWGRSPEATVALLREKQIPTVRGNHDYFSDDGYDFTGTPLTGRTMQYLDSLPKTRRQSIAGVRVVMCHGRPGDEMAGLYPESPGLAEIMHAASADILIVGHTHVPMRIAMAHGIIVNPGSLLREVCADEPVKTSATFGVLELPSRRFAAYRVTDGVEVELKTAGG